MTLVTSMRNSGGEKKTKKRREGEQDGREKKENSLEGCG